MEVRRWTERHGPFGFCTGRLDTPGPCRVPLWPPKPLKRPQAVSGLSNGYPGCPSFSSADPFKDYYWSSPEIFDGFRFSGCAVSLIRA